MTASRIQQAVERLVSTGLATPSTIHGCTEAQVEALEAACGLSLPMTYREFLRLVGKRAGAFLVGSDLTYETLIENQAAARDLAEESGLEWPEDGFAFVLHQGYCGWMFRAGGRDEPVCLEACVRSP